MPNADRHQSKARRLHSDGYRFLLTCAAGFEQVVSAAVEVDVPRARIAEVHSGMLLVEVTESRSVVGRLAHLDYLTGVHQIVVEESAGSGGPDACVKRFEGALRAGRASTPAATFRTFRLRVIEEGQPVKVGGACRDALEVSIQRWSGIRPERRGGGAEVWVYRRRDDPRVWLTLRLDRPKRRRSPAGALKPEVAGALVRVAPTSPRDVFLDPFAGSGAVSAARARLPHARIVLSDVDPAKVRDLRTEAGRGVFGRHAEVHGVEVGYLVPAVVAPGSVDVAVLDPPWGHFDRTMGHGDLAAVYGAVITMLDVALAERGHAVVLVADEDLLLDTVGRAVDLGVIDSLPVLVNGKKARVVHLARGSASIG